MTSRAIQLLLDECAFNPRTLQIRFPNQAIEACELPAQYFFGTLEDAPNLNAFSFLDKRWRADRISKSAYERAGPEGRIEVNAILCAMLHEISHRVDLLITPFGVQYVIMAIEEYLLLQQFVPQTLDRDEYLGALCLLRNVADGLPPAAARQPRMAELWPRLRDILRRTLAWGDLGKRRPPESEIALGWFGEDHRLDDLRAKQGEPNELITVCGSVRTFRPKGTRGWYVRPMTIFEAKALANTLLYVLDLSKNSVGEVHLFFEACYGDPSRDLEPDYLYIFDAVSRLGGWTTLADSLTRATPQQLGTLLRLVSGICWFALHAPPVLTDQRHSPAAASVTMRLFAALEEIGPMLRAKPSFTSMSAICSQLEDTAFFKGLEQAPIEEALSESRRALDVIEPHLDDVWNPDVRSWFKHLIATMRPYFTQREARYDSLLGMPNDGNVVSGARQSHEWEALYDDHVPTGGAAEWLALRHTLLFSYGVPKRSDDLVRKLGEHFDARLKA